MLRTLLYTALVTTIVTASFMQNSYVNATTAFLDTDKDEVSLGDDLTILLAEPDANFDSRTIEKIPFSKILISTNKFDETPLDNVIIKTGISVNHSFLRETGFNTGIFEVTLESINDSLANRGSQIRIIYFDNTPSGGGSAIRVETVIPVVEARIAVMFDRNEYSPFDQVTVKLIGKMFNVNRNKIDTLNTPTGGKVAITTNDQTYYPPMFETGVDTNTFVGKVRLTADQNEKDGDLIVTSGDRIRVTVTIVPGFELSDLASIVSTVGSISLDRSEYSAGDVVRVNVIDRDENRDPDAIDTVKARIWSNSDISGIELTLRETETSSGIFEGTLTLSSDRTGNLLVSENDVLIAFYKDRTLPSYAETNSLFATATIGTSVGVIVSKPTIIVEDNNVESVEIGTKTTIQSSITNVNNAQETLVYIIRVIDENGFTSHISFVTGTLEPYQSISVGRNWIPDMKGKYAIEVFTWGSLTEPTVLSTMKRTTIVVR